MENLTNYFSGVVKWGCEFPGVVKKRLAEFPAVAISKGYQEKAMWNFQGVLCFALEFPGV